MYDIGDKIVYPMHGAGVIEEIEEKNILGEVRSYYVLKVPCGNMKIMIPVETSEDAGVRDIINSAELEAVLAVLGQDSTEMSTNWNRRYRENMDKLKTGKALEVAEVVRNLIRSERRKKLSAGEKKLLTNARQILLSEMVLVGDLDLDSASHLIDTAV